MHAGSTLRGWLLVGALLLPVAGGAQDRATKPVGAFQGSSDIGQTQPGQTSFDPSTKSYRMSGGGVDIWGTADAFSYTWRRMAGNGTLSASVAFERPLAYPISKGVLMFRQSLDPGAAYADVAIHADGHITLQYRATQGGETKDVTLPEHGPTRVQVERNGDVFTASAVFADGHLGTPASINVPMHDPVYVGLGVGSHNDHALQTVLFSDVKLTGAK